MAYDAVLESEQAWYETDLTASGVPALLKAQGGPFDIVASHVRRLAQARAQLYLTHGPTTQARGAKAGVRLDHQVIALVLYAAVGAGARAHVDQDSLEAAVGRVVARVLGPAGDVDHGGRWFRVGPVATEPVGLEGLLQWGDAIAAAGAAHVVAVRYTVSEYL